MGKDTTNVTKIVATLNACQNVNSSVLFVFICFAYVCEANITLLNYNRHIQTELGWLRTSTSFL